MINYYIDPGSGFVLTQNASFVLVIIMGALGGILFFMKAFFKFFKKLILWIVLLSIVIIGGLMTHKIPNKNKVIVIGIDAMDPGIVEKLMNEGKLLNFSRLAKMGNYAHLKTTVPSESIVAWTTFLTGLNPADHGVFDFIMRNPKNYLPYLAFNETSNANGKTEIKIRRKGESLWAKLTKKNVPCLVYYCPNTFPPERIFGKMISGMGVPDCLGTMGKFSFYTTKLSKADEDSRGRVINVENSGNVIKTKIYGPKFFSGNSNLESFTPLKISIYSDEERILIEYGRSKLFLKKGEWSQWGRVSFNTGMFNKVHGICRFYLKSVKPDLELYLSPINFDPKYPLFPISYPKNYSAELVKQVGLYYTQGMPYDTWALTEDRIDEKAFLQLADSILKENQEVLDVGLKDFKNGLLFFYFEGLDPIQHMFWRYIDPKHPFYENNPQYTNIIYEYYERMDKILGDIMNKIDFSTNLIVFSDHGFASFRKAIHLNRWLLENGYLSFEKGADESKEFFDNVDWSRTKAYAVGFGGIYLNAVQREYYGSVHKLEINNLKNEIKRKLMEFRDPLNGENVIKNVYTREEAFQGLYSEESPDLYVGFNNGYRASWQTALGGTPKLLIEDNKKKWSGDHLIDPSLVPGVIFVNKKIELNNLSIKDLALFISSLLGVDVDK